MKTALEWFCIVFFGTLITVLGFKMAMLVVTNIMEVLAR